MVKGEHEHGRSDASHRKASQSSHNDATRQASMQAMASKQMSSHASSSSSRPKPPTRIGQGKYEVGKKLGAGCFGEVFMGKTAEGMEVAVKFEALEARTQQLEQEVAIMALLRTQPCLPCQTQGFSECFWFGREGRYQCMVMELLGKSLEDTVEQCENKRFKPLTAALCGEQLVRRIEYLHSKGIIHRDIKPENFMWGKASKVHHIHMIDFGLSKRYFDKSHVVMREKLSLTGTARYASINAHRGFEQSRRDDLEAIGHMLIYFLRGSLPWSGLEAKTQEEKYRKIKMKKEEVPLDVLCTGYPDAFKLYLRTARNLEFRERPNYTALRKFFEEVREQHAPLEDHQLQWLQGRVTAAELEPLQPWELCRQPDDQAAPRRFGFCFCGKAKVKE